MSAEHKHSAVSASEAKQRLIDGNARFVSGSLANKDLSDARRHDLVANGQHPFAVVVTCSDSRVPPELLFDQALGNIFVVRTAGNVVDPIGVGSVEYGAEHLHAQLVVVLGHEKCGAVAATVEGGEAPGSIGAIVNKIKPSVEKVRATGLTGHELCKKAEDENIAATIADLKQSEVMKHLAHHGEVTIIGAKYLLESGKVVFMD